VPPADGEDKTETGTERHRSGPGESEVDESLDESLEESFPSSDPPSSWAGPDPDE